jgi:hypothetical protein
MVFVSLLVAPVVVAAAAVIDRRLGPSAAGWVAALPASLGVAVVAVTLDAGDDTAGTMTLSAAAHVPAQVAFAVVFAAVLTHRDLLLGGAAGTLAYVVCSLGLARVPVALAVALAVPAIAVVPGLVTASRPRVGSPRRWSTTAITCAAASAIVGAAVLTSRFAGPVAAGAVAAFPTMSTTLAFAVAARDGSRAGAHALLGMVRSLPCYLAFCLVVALVAPSIGLPAIALALLACVAAGRVTWRYVPLAPRVAAAR